MNLSYTQYFKNKKITVMGLGLLGRGLGVVKFLSECGAILTVTDLKDKTILKPTLKQLKKYPNITYILGHHRLEDFRNKDLIIKSAGVPLDSIYIDEAKKNNILIEMDASLFAKFSDAVIIGVTGTRGKSTTAGLIYEMLRKAGKKVYLGGNIKGIATLPLLKKVKAGNFVVLELDSWQLQGFGDSKISPHIAVFTNLMPDHLNYYGGNMEKYFQDKANIFRYQKREDFLVLSKNSQSAIKKYYKKPLTSQIISVSAKDVPSNWQHKLAGIHNLKNISFAIKVGELLGISEQKIKTSVEQFKTLPGRLELIKTYKGIRIYNDTNSTTPDATLAGLRTLSKNKNIVLIMGGSDKNIKMDSLIAELPRYCKAVVLLPGTGTDKIKNKISKLKNIELHHAVNLKDAVSLSVSLASKNDIVLFSPAFASFGMFKNEYDRGDKFIEIIKNL